MFILRRITSENVEINTSLDDEYVLVTKQRNPKEFQETAGLLKFDKGMDKDVYGFVTFNDGENIMPLYEKSTYYIMASDGKTFANISFK